MPGKFCTGAVTNNAYLLVETKAFCEGLNYRAGGTLLGRPKTDNQHAAGSEAAEAWDRGWETADAAAPLGTITPSDAPCCAVPTNVVIDT